MDRVDEFFRNNERLGLRLVAGGILFALVVVGTSFRLYRLAELPPALGNDEAAHGVDALNVMQGQHALFFPENHGREGMVVYLVALAISFLGRTILAVRLPTALASSVTIFVVFWLGWILFGHDEKTDRAEPWRGLFVGSVAAGLMAVSLAQISFGRIAYRANFFPLLLTLCVALFWLGWRRKSWWQITLSGICAGLLPYTYLSARIVPLFFFLFGLSFLLPAGSRSKLKARADLPWIVLFLVVAGLVAAPILIHFAMHPGHFSSRTHNLWIFAQEGSLLDSLNALLSSVWKYLLILGFRDQEGWFGNYFSQFILFPHEGFFFWLGAGIALWRWRQQPKYRLLLLWAGVLLLPPILSTISLVRTVNTLRMIGAVPAIYLLVAVGLWETVQFLKARMPLAHKTSFGVLAGTIVCSAILIQGVLSFHTYFQIWERLAANYRASGSEWTELALWLNDRQTSPDTLYIIPSRFAPWSYVLDFLYMGEAPVRTVDVRSSDFARRIEEALAEQSVVQSVKGVEWNTNNYWIDDDFAGFSFLLEKYGRFVESKRFPDFKVHTYTDISLNTSWNFYEQMEPLSVRYDGGISLTGFALGRSQTQVPSQTPIEVGKDRSLWGFLQWQLGPELHVDYALSLRLYSDSGARVYQADNVIWKLSNHTPTSHWAENEVVESLFYLDLPTDLQSGSYDLRLVVYDFETQLPTVETGVWKPETSLARLHLSFPPGAKSQDQP